MNYLIVGFVAIGVFIYLLYALPDSALTDSRYQSASHDAVIRVAGLSRKLSRNAALGISLGLLFVFAVLLGYDWRLAPVISMVVVTTSLWAALDSHRIGLRRYKTRIALHPIALFNSMCVLWPVLFPWYLIVCSRIGDGTIAKKSEVTSRARRR